MRNLELPVSEIRPQIDYRSSHFDNSQLSLVAQLFDRNSSSRDDFDSYGINNFNEQDPMVEQFFDLSLNTPLPEKFPLLSQSQSEFAEQAVSMLSAFADSFPKPESVDSLNALTKLFKETRISPDVVDAINMLLDKQQLRLPVRLGLSEVTGLICLGTDDGDGHFSKRFLISDNRGIKR